MKLFGLILNLAIRVLIVYFLAEVLLNQADPRFAEKAIPLRNLVIVFAFISVLPFIHFLKNKLPFKIPWKTYPFWYDNLYLSIFLLDMAGNSFNLYDTYYYFDLIPHFHALGALSVVLAGLFGLPLLSAIGASSIVHTLLEAQEYYTDVLFGTKNVRGIFDIANDLTAGIIGSFIYIAVFLFLKKQKEQVVLIVSWWYNICMAMPEIPHLTLEQLPAKRKEVADIREMPGREQEAIRLAKLYGAEATRLGAHEHAVGFIWEECLSAKHMIMSGDTTDLPRSIYKKAAMTADAYIQRHDVESMRIRSRRFLGEAAMLEGDYNSAVSLFKQAAFLFEGSPEPEEKVNALELRGFQAEALIRSGKVQEGIALGAKTFGDFDKGIGVDLKGRDYYTWAVWKTGIVIKTWNGILDTNTELNESEIKELTAQLSEAKRVLNVPPDPGWPSNFEYRKDEIAKLEQRIAQAA